MDKKAAFVALIGRPSSGKSTLLNHFCQHKVSIVTPVPQTTRNKIRGIVTRDEGQLVVVDTPGYHISEKKMNLFLRRLAVSTLEEVDLVLYVIDLTRDAGEEEREILKRLDSFDGKVVIALNKTELTQVIPENTQKILEERDLPTLMISALTGGGVDKLLHLLFSLAPEGAPYYPEEYYTDQEPEFRIAEIIREKAMLRTRQEVPHSLYVSIDESEFQNNRLWVRVFIYVERMSQRGIVVGNGGMGIREIRRASQRELKTLFPYPIDLDLRVKLNKKWRHQDKLLKRIIT